MIFKILGSRCTLKSHVCEDCYFCYAFSKSARRFSIEAIVKKLSIMITQFAMVTVLRMVGWGGSTRAKVSHAPPNKLKIEKMNTARNKRKRREKERKTRLGFTLPIRSANDCYRNPPSAAEVAQRL